MCVCVLVDSVCVCVGVCAHVCGWVDGYGCVGVDGCGCVCAWMGGCGCAYQKHSMCMVYYCLWKPLNGITEPSLAVVGCTPLFMCLHIPKVVPCWNFKCNMILPEC